MARERAIATALIRNADPSRYGTLITDLANQYAMQKDNNPKDITSAESLLVVMYKTPTKATAVRNGNQHRQQQQSAAPTNDVLSGMTLAQRTAIAVATGTTLTQHAYVLAQAARDSDHGVDPDWILLNSQSTISVFKNADFLTNIRHSGRVLRAFTNRGHQDSIMVGDFPNLGEMWFSWASIANILSLAEVRKVCRVTMDTTDEPALFVHRLDGSVMKFAEHPSGLYIYKSISTSDQVTEYSYTMVWTVAQQKKLFSLREIRAADDARALYRKIGRPDEAEFQSILKKNLIMNCLITSDDARRAHIIYGPDIAVIKGKSTRSVAAPRAPTFVAEPIPAPIFEHHRNVTLCADFFFVQSLPFSIQFHAVLVFARRPPSPTAPSLLSYENCATPLGTTPHAASPYATYTGTTSSNVLAHPVSIQNSTLSLPTVMLVRLRGPSASSRSVFAHVLMVCLSSAFPD